MILDKKDLAEDNSEDKLLYIPPKINNLNLKEKTLGGPGFTGTDSLHPTESGPIS